MKKNEPITASKGAIDAFRKEDPTFCQFLEETGRIEQKDEQEKEHNHETDTKNR